MRADHRGADKVQLPRNFLLMRLGIFFLEIGNPTKSHLNFLAIPSQKPKIINFGERESRCLILTMASLINFEVPFLRGISYNSGETTFSKE